MVFSFLEINFHIIVTALDKSFHFFNGNLSGVRACASVCNCVLCDLGKSLKKDILGNKAVFAGIAVKAVVLDALRNDYIYSYVGFCSISTAAFIAFFAVRVLSALRVARELRNRECHRTEDAAGIVIGWRDALLIGNDVFGR